MTYLEALDKVLTLRAKIFYLKDVPYPQDCCPVDFMPHAPFLCYGEPNGCVAEPSKCLKCWNQTYVEYTFHMGHFLNKEIFLEPYRKGSYISKT